MKTSDFYTIRKSKRHSAFIRNTLILLSFTIVFNSRNTILSQLYIKDLLVVSFRDLTGINKIPLSIDTIIDLRGKPGKEIGVTEKKQYKYVPVDYFICTGKDLNLEIHDMFERSRNDPFKYRLYINEFNVRKKNYHIIPALYLNTSIQVYYGAHNDSMVFLGEILHESKYSKLVIKETDKTGYDRVLESWQGEFLSDMDSIHSEITRGNIPELENVRTQMYTGKIKNMYVGGDIILGTDFWLIDGEIYFSHREVRRFFLRKGYNLRYRNEKDFESIEFSLLNSHFNYRINTQLLLKGKLNGMIGCNKWKNVEEYKPDLWDIAMLDISLSQNIVWNPLDRKSFIIGFGLFESVNYIYSKNVRFQPGVLMHMGLKL